MGAGNDSSHPSPAISLCGVAGLADTFPSLPVSGPLLPPRLSCPFSQMSFHLSLSVAHCFLPGFHVPYHRCLSISPCQWPIASSQAFMSLITDVFPSQPSQWPIASSSGFHVPSHRCLSIATSFSRVLPLNLHFDNCSDVFCFNSSINDCTICLC